MTLSKDTATGLNVVPLWINGQNTTSTSARFPVYCFEHQKDVFLAESADKESATRAVDAALKAFKTWKKTPVIPRRNLLLKVASIVRARVEELVQAQREETSVIELWARKNVSLAADVVEEVASSLSSMRGEIPQTASEGSLALVLNEPIGPILTIAPWNSSVILALRAISTPIAAGCTVVLKASELCPRTHHLLAEIFEEAGLPAGVLNVVQTRREDAASITETIIAHPGIRKIDFIGSAPVGKLIGQVAAKYLKPILMELGGKGPAIVLDDADLEQAAKKCITGAFLHHGQLCFSTERIIVLEKIAPQFQELLKQEAAHFIPGSGAAEGLVDKSKDKLADAERKGAKFLIGGPSYGGIASLVPTILTGVTPEMEIYHEESFGPSVALFIARDDAHAIEIANDTPYGLNAAIHSKDMGRALDVAREIECAQVHINNMTAHDEPTLPVGGSRGSGWGRCNASWGLNEFVAPKLITLSATGNKFL